MVRFLLLEGFSLEKISGFKASCLGISGVADANTACKYHIQQRYYFFCFFWEFLHYFLDWE